MQTLTMSLIGALAIGSFLIFQDYDTVPPYGKFTFSPYLYIGEAIVTGAIIALVVLFIKRKTTKRLT